jgi:hypothetical protein
MPIYDPSGRPLTPGQLVGAKKLADYDALNRVEFAEVCRQIEEGLSAGVPDHVPVTIPTIILARILRTVLEGYRGDEAATVAAPVESADFLTPIPDVTALRDRVRVENEILETKA